jgi:hypothetical protein
VGGGSQSKFGSPIISKNQETCRLKGRLHVTCYRIGFAKKCLQSGYDNKNKVFERNLADLFKF